jgi:predicted metalloprotease with PDZ domain
MRKGMIFGAMLVAMGVAGAEAQQPTPRPAPRVEERPARVAAARGWLGMTLRTTDGEVTVVGEVMRSSPAARAGVQAGDTVTLWNGRRDVSTAIGDRPLEPGDTVRLRVRRGSQRELNLAVVAGSRPEALVLGRGDDGEDVVVIRPRELERSMRIFSDSMIVGMDSLFQSLQLRLRDSLGVHFREFERNELPRIREELREMERNLPRISGERLVFELGTRSVAGAEFAEINEGLAPHFGTDEGVLVLKVASGTPAARAGLRAGDVVIRVNDQPVAAIDELRRGVARAQTRDPRAVTLHVLRSGQRRELQMRWE